MYLNADRARGLMERHGIDAIIASTPENVTYLAETVTWSNKVYAHSAHSAHMFALFPLDEGTPPALVVPGGDVTYVSAQNSWVKDYYTYGPKSALIVPRGESVRGPEEEAFLGMVTNDARRSKGPADALARALRDRRLTRARIGLDEERVKPNVRVQLGEALPEATFVEASDLFRLIRMVKTPAELDALRAAAGLNERACTAASRAVAAGVTELEVATVYRTEVARGGGMWHWYHFGSGRRSVAIFPPTGKKIQKGDLWAFDAGLTLNNFQADTGWGGVIGEPTKEHMRIWAASKAGFEAALDKVRAGVLPSEIFRAAWEATRAAGLPDHDGRFAGHSIGLEPREIPHVLADPSPVHSPFLPPTTDIPIEEGATLCVENPCRIFGLGGTQLERTVIVTRSGYAPLIPQERKFWVVAA